MFQPPTHLKPQEQYTLWLSLGCASLFLFMQRQAQGSLCNFKLLCCQQFVTLPCTFASLCCQPLATLLTQRRKKRLSAWAMEDSLKYKKPLPETWVCFVLKQLCILIETGPQSSPIVNFLKARSGESLLDWSTDSGVLPQDLLCPALDIHRFTTFLISSRNNFTQGTNFQDSSKSIGRLLNDEEVSDYELCIANVVRVQSGSNLRSGNLEPRLKCHTHLYWLRFKHCIVSLSYSKQKCVAC